MSTNSFGIEIGTSGLKNYWLFHAVDWARTVAKQTIKVPLTLLVDNGSLLYALVSVFHPDWLIRRTSGYAGVTICIKIITNLQVKMKNARAMLAKSLSLIDEYANLWRSSGLPRLPTLTLFNKKQNTLKPFHRFFTFKNWASILAVPIGLQKKDLHYYYKFEAYSFRLYRNAIFVIFLR